MSTLAFLLIQTVNPPLANVDPLVRFDLRDVVVSKECHARAEEIVVCATTFLDLGRNRLREPVGAKFVYDNRADKEIVPGVIAAVQTEQAGLGAGVTSNRLMVRMKIKF